MAENGGAYDGSINIRTRLDNSEIGSDITALRSKLDGLSQKLGNMFKGGIKTSGLAQQLVSIRQKLEAITADNTGEKLRAQFDAAQAEALRYEQRLVSMVRRLDEMKARITQQQGAFTPTAEYKQLESDINSIGKAMDAAQAEAARYEQQLITYEEHRRKKIEELSAAYERLNMKVQTAAGREERSTRTVSSNVNKANKSIADTSKAAGAAAKSTRNFGEMLSRTAKRILIFRIVHTVFQAIATRFSALIEKNEELKTSLRTLKGSVLMAFQPLLDAVVPVLTKIFSIAAKVFKVIAAIIAALFGKTAAQAAASSAALDEEAGAISGVGSAAKKASKSLANFDEINQLTADTAGGAGGGGAGSGLGAIYDTEGLKNIYAWLEKIKQSEAFQRMKEAWDRLKAKWDEFVNNPAVKKILEKIGQVLTDVIIPALLNSAWASLETGFDLLGDILDLLGAIASGDWSKSINSLKNVLADIVGGPLLVLSGMFDDIFGTNTQAKIREIIKTIKEFDFAEWLADAMLNAGNWVIGAIEDIANFLIDAFNWVRRALNNAWTAIGNGFKWVFNKIIDGVNKTISLMNNIFGTSYQGLQHIEAGQYNTTSDYPHIHFPRLVRNGSRGGGGGGGGVPVVALARGAVIPPNAPFLAMLGDQKRGTNIEAPLDTLVEAFKAAQSNTPVTIRFEGSLAQLGQLLKPVIDSENKRKGGTFAVIGG